MLQCRFKINYQSVEDETAVLPVPCFVGRYTLSVKEKNHVPLCTLILIVMIIATVIYIYI